MNLDTYGECEIFKVKFSTIVLAEKQMFYFFIQVPFGLEF